MSWDYELEDLIIDWKEIKTGDVIIRSKLLDCHHSLACYLIFDGGKSALTASSDANWIVPDLARIQETAASVMTKYVRSIFESLSDTCLSNSVKEYEGTSLR